jgi:hypothetical protein
VGRRFVLLIATLVTASCLGATATAATPEEDARATADAFVDALLHGNAERLCSLLSPAALERLGGPEQCRSSFTDTEADDDEDYDAVDTLMRAYTAARLSATKRKGRFVTPKFGPRKLARDMEQLDSELTVKLGHSSAAAKGQLATTVILDTRSTARRVVLYAESDSGSIYRLSGTTGGRPSYDEVGVGIPEASPSSEGPPERTVSAAISSVTVDTTGTAFARGTYTLTLEDHTFRLDILVVLVRVDGSYFVDDIFFSTLTGQEP